MTDVQNTDASITKVQASGSNNDNGANVQSTNTNDQQPTKRRRLRMPSALTIIIGVVFFVIFLTWIPHGNGDATAITVDGVEYAAGSLGAWQNWIIFDFFSTYGATYGDAGSIQLAAEEFASANGIAAEGETSAGIVAINMVVSVYDLQGEWVKDVGFVTEASVPFTLGSYADGTTSMFGFFDSIKAFAAGYLMAWDVAFYVITMYAMVLLLMETHTLKNGVNSLIRGLGGREILLVPILFILFSLGGTLFGMQEETIGLMTVVVPVLILAGYDATTGLLVAVVGTTTGIASSVLDPFSIGVMAEGLGYGIGDGIVSRMVLFLAITPLTCVLVTFYAMWSKGKKDDEGNYQTRSVDADKIEENKAWAEEHIGDIKELETMTGAQKFALSVFGITFLVMTLSLMPWPTFFPSLADSTGWNWFSGILFGQVLFGEWYFVELSIMFIFVLFIMGTPLGYSANKLMNLTWEATKTMIGVITIIAFSRSVSVIMSSSGLTYGLIYGMVDQEKLATMSPVMFALIWLLVLTVMAVFIPSTSGLAGVAAPIIGGVIASSVSLSSGLSPEEMIAHKDLLAVSILLVYPLAQGCINMFSPTAGITVVQAEVAKVNYTKALPLLAAFAGITFLVGTVTSLSMIAIMA